jgi:hypothetical protein
MMTSADEYRAQMAWEERRLSGNPIYPWEWSVLYVNGARFHRVCAGRVRTTAQAPLMGVAGLLVWMRGKSHFIQSPTPSVERIVVESTIVRALGVTHGKIAGWRFGFMRGEQFVGVTISADGTAVWSR